MLKILVISDIAPQDPLNGVHLRFWDLLDKGNAHVLCLRQKVIGENGKSIETYLPWKNITLIDNRTLTIYPIKHSDLLIENFVKKNKQAIEEIKSAYQQYFLENSNIAIIAHGHEMGLIVSVLFKQSFIFDGCDSKSLYFYRRFKALSIKQPIKKINSLYMSVVYRLIEKYIADNSSLYVVPSGKDREWILRLSPQASVKAIGNGTNWLKESPIKKKKNREGSSLTISFHGAMTWDPNRSSALYLIREVFPLVRVIYPDATLRIAGAPIFEELAALNSQEGVEICGFVDDIREWLSECDIYAMPMLQGSGVKNKLIEAMAAGLPIVTNSMGAEALPDEAKNAIIIADGSQAIADAIIDLFQNPEKRLELRQKARLAAEKYFQWETLSEQYMKAIAETRRSIP